MRKLLRRKNGATASSELRRLRSLVQARPHLLVVPPSGQDTCAFLQQEHDLVMGLSSPPAQLDGSVFCFDSASSG